MKKPGWETECLARLKHFFFPPGGLWLLRRRDITLGNTKNHKKSQKMDQGGGCRSKFGLRSSKIVKMMQKWRPRGGACLPQRGSKITKILKKRYPPKRHFFEPCLGTIFNSFGDEKVIQNHENLVKNKATSILEVPGTLKSPKSRPKRDPKKR